jgi:hypothetical protein
MSGRKTFFQIIVLSVSLVLILACSLAGSGAVEEPDRSSVETEIAFGIMSTSLANQQMTLQAMQAQITQQAVNIQPTQPLQPTQASELPQPPTQALQPSPVPGKTEAPPPAELVLDIRKSTDTFYCYQAPYELTITVRVSDINRGMAVYYHIQDKNSGVTSAGQVIDLHRRTSDTRDATIIGGGSSKQNLQFPPLMGESYFVYQIISDDGIFRSPVFSDITFYPCAQ